MRINQKCVMPMDYGFRIRCEKAWKEALEGVSKRQKLRFADWVRQTLAEKAIGWYRENKLPVPEALLDLSVERTDAHTTPPPAASEMAEPPTTDKDDKRA
jgi:hypothetical protein